MYKEYLAEFWYSAKALENSKVSFSTPTGGIYGEVGVNTFRNAISAHTPPSLMRAVITAKWDSPKRGLLPLERLNAQPEGALSSKYKGKKAMSSKDAEEVSTESGSERLKQHMVYCGEHVHLNKEHISAQKKIKEEAKAEAAKREGEMRKEELIDLLGPEVVNKYIEKMIQVKSFVSSNPVTYILVNEEKLLKHLTKGYKHTVQYEDQPAGLTQGPGKDDHARTFSFTSAWLILKKKKLEHTQQIKSLSSKAIIYSKGPTKDKFEKSYALASSYRDDAFHKHDHDDHQGDDAPLEGEKSPKSTLAYLPIPHSDYPCLPCNNMKKATLQNERNGLDSSLSEHAYWKATSVPTLDPSPSSTTNKVEVPKELPKVSMVNTSLKELKRYLTGFDQAVEQHRLESRTFEVKMNQVLSENERLLAQAIDHDIVKTIVNLSVNDGCETVNECQKCLELKTELLNKKDFVDKETYDKLCKSFTTLEKHCITLEADSQLNQENFQLENSVLNQNAPSFTQLFELSELRAQSQAKDTVIVKLKEQIKSLKGNVDDSKVKMDMDEIETLNIELEHRVTKLVAENEHLKQTYKQLYDSIKPKRVQSKEQCDALIKQVNIKSGEISDLNAKLQEQGLVIAALKNELRKLKGKAVDKEAIETHSVDPNVSKDNMEPITPKLLNKRTAHSSYIKHTQEEALVLRDIVEHVKANYPHDSLLESAFRYTKVIQDLLSHISRSCPSINNFGPQLVEVTPRKKDKKVRFAESLTSTENTKTDSTSNIVSNKRVLHSTGNLKKQDNSDCVGIHRDDCMSSDNLCVSNSLNVVKSRAKPKKNKSKKDIWKPTGKVFTQIGYIWRPTGRTFTIVGNACPLTRITTTNEVPSRKPIVLDSESPKPVVKLVYSRKPRKNTNTESVSKTKVVQIVLWYLDSGCSKHMTGDRSQLTNFISKFLGTVKFGNDQVAKIMGLRQTVGKLQFKGLLR
ncbi:hypothetical protein Tco_0004483 [Tanacetum coccineum]